MVSTVDALDRALAIVGHEQRLCLSYATFSADLALYRRVLSEEKYTRAKLSYKCKMVVPL